MSLPLAVAAAKLIWQPAPRAQAAARTEKLPALPWHRLGAPVGVSLLEQQLGRLHQGHPHRL